MKRQTILTLAVALAAALLMGTAVHAMANASRIDFTVTEYVCGLGMEDYWEEGNVMHIRGYEHRNVDISSTAEVNGLNTTFADADINMLTGIGNIRGTFSIQPQGIDGAWKGTWVFNGTPGVGFARGVGRGTGVFNGQLIFLKVYDTDPDPATNAAMCAGIGEPGGVEIVKGYILVP